MKQTSTYKLNQWDKSDRIQMEDFNGDNEKLEAALEAVTARVDTKAEQSALNAEKAARESRDAALEAANCWMKLKEAAIGAVHQVDVDVSGINWDLYRKVVIELSVQTDVQSTYAHLRLNGRSDSIYHTGDNTAGDHLNACARCNDGGFSTIVLTAAPNGTVMGEITDAGFDRSLFYGSTGFWVQGLKLAQVTSLQFYADTSCKFVSGSMTFYGLKK